MRRVIRPADAEWPRALTELGPADPPRLLHAVGEPLEPQTVHVAVVGTRRPTYAGVDAARTFAAAFAEADIVVVSGLAVGIDAAAHDAALGAGGRTVAVLGCGLDVRYPAANARLRDRIAAAGTVVTEYEDGVSPRPHHFPARNRIIAGLSAGVVVVEGALTSGALVTARLALDANRSVWAVPGSVRNPMAAGPNELIRTGRAALATDAAHVFEELAPRLAWRDPAAPMPAPAVDDAEAAVLGALDDVAVAPELLARAAGLAPGLVAATLARLEVRALAARTRGGFVVTAAGSRVRAALNCAEPGLTPPA